MTARPPGAIIGILGGGQLGRMLAMAAARLGLKTHIYTDVSGPALDVCANQTLGAYDDIERVREFAKAVDVVTYEFENVPVATAAEVQKWSDVRPGTKALEVSQDRSREKRFIHDLGVPVAPFVECHSADDVVQGMRKLKAPAILKTARFGYDGKGQARVDDHSDEKLARNAFDTIGAAPGILEVRINFDFEISIIAVRAHDGDIAFYDTPRNVHRDGILRESIVPVALPQHVVARGREITKTIADALDYVGIIAVEFFYLANEAEHLIVNEFAPRVHNSGHWTMDACAVSQFENHIRAVAGWPLGTCERHANVVMTNLIGHNADTWRDLAAKPDTCIHLYGKPEARENRKMGHVNVLTPKTDV